MSALIGGICTRRLRAMSGHCSSAITVDANAFAGSSLQVGSRLIRSIALATRSFSIRDVFSSRRLSHNASQLAGELFKVMAGVEMTHIPYRGGGPAATNLLGGQVDVFFAPVSTVMQYIKAGKLRALAVSSTTRFQELPDVPTVSDFVSGYEASYWIGLGAPKKTPGEIVTKLNKEVNAALATPDMQARFAQQGAIVAGGSPSDFEKFISDETQKWGKVIKTANIKPE